MFCLRTVAAAAVLLGALRGGVAGGQAGRVGVRGGGSVPLAAGAVPADVASALKQMAGLAGVIFTGQVEGVSRVDAAGYVDVRFRVDEVVRGCAAGTSYVLREWAGLWSGQERYRVGERRLMLLTARGVGGMSAPVGGMDGAIPLLGMGVQPLADAAGKAPADDGKGTDAAATGVDLRWIAARVMRGSGSTVRSLGKSAAVVKVVEEQGTGGSGAGGSGAGTLEWSGPVGALAGIRNLEGGAVALPVSVASVLVVLRGGRGGD